MSPAGSAHARVLAVPPLTGLLVGMATGAVEIAWASAWGTPLGERSALFPSMAFYGVLWAILGLIASLALAALLMCGRRPGEATVRAAALVGFGALSSLILVGGYLNLRWLPSYDSPLSLGADAVLLGAHALLTALIGRQLARRWARRSDPAPAGPLGPRAGILAAALVGLSLAITYLPEETGRLETLPLGERLPSGVGEGARPNILLLLVDTLRADHVGCYGYPRPTSPHCDSLARSGVRFSRALSQSSWTKPAVASLFTSLYPATHQANLVTERLDEHLTTLPEYLKVAGYATGIFSANTLISPLFGFTQRTDRYAGPGGSLAEGLMLGHALWIVGITQRSAALTTLRREMRRLELLLRREATSCEVLTARQVNRRFLRWARDVRRGPFFAYLHYMEPHDPYRPPSPFAEAFRPAGVPPVSRFPPFKGFLPFDPASPLPTEQREALVAAYDGEIAATDAAIGDLLRVLRRGGILDRTIVILTADHGEEFYDHGGWGHGHSLHEELLRVPLIWSGPGIARGRTVEGPVRLVDLLPTVLDLCGVPPPEGIEGRSLRPLLAEGGTLASQSDSHGEAPLAPGASVAGVVPIYSEVSYGGRWARSLREGPYKLIEARDGMRHRRLLYDLTADPDERRDLAPERAGLVAGLGSQLDSLHASALKKSGGSTSVRIDPATEDRLRALGYLN